MQRAAVQTMSPQVSSQGELQLICADQDHLPVPQHLDLRAPETPSAHGHLHFDFFICKQERLLCCSPLCVKDYLTLIQ